jgi:hypothetical protein
MARCAFHTQPNCDTTCFCNEGWICEAHPDQGWPHDDCAGPGEPCPRCDTDESAATTRRLAVVRQSK